MSRFEPSPSFSSRKLIIAALALIVWSFFLWRGIQVFTPGVYSAVAFDSDCAVPVLMANDERPITAFNLYYYGHDRWGGWPLLVAQLVRRATGYRWSARALATMQIVWLFAGAIVFGALAGRHWGLAALVFLFSLCTIGDPSHQMFFLSQVQAWQVTALLLSWYSLRQLFAVDALHRLSGRRALWLIATFLFSYLAIWSSITSSPFLLFLFAIESLRARWQTRSSQNRVWRKSLMMGLVVLVGATIAERLQVAIYHRAAMRSFGTDFRTPLQIDFGFLLNNLGIQLAKLVTNFSLPLVLSSAPIIATICALVYVIASKRDRFVSTLRTIVANDAAVVAIGAFGIALINFVLSVAVTHVRVNEYDQRFLLLTNVFGTISGILVLYLFVTFVAHARVQYPLLISLIALSIVFSLMFPRGSYHADYRAFDDATQGLKQKSQRAILLGDYWSVYVLAALAPNNYLTPVPFDGQQNRMPWTRDMLRTTGEVLLQFTGSLLETATLPPERLSQYGVHFRLVEPRWYDSGTFAFARYVKDDTTVAEDDAAGITSLARLTYVQILARQPDATELQQFVAQLDNCHRDAGCIQDRTTTQHAELLNSSEFQTTSGFIDQLYVVALGRAPTYDEWERDRKRLTAIKDRSTFLAEWSQQHQLNNTGITSAVETIEKSRPAVESDEAFVRLCYFVFLRRDADAAGFTHWLNIRRSGPNGKVAVIGGLLNSGEYRSRFPRV